MQVPFTPLMVTEEEQGPLFPLLRSLHPPLLSTSKSSHTAPAAGTCCPSLCSQPRALHPRLSQGPNWGPDPGPAQHIFWSWEQAGSG